VVVFLTVVFFDKLRADDTWIMYMDETNFLNSALSNESAAWNGLLLHELARLQVPDSLMGEQRSLMRADINEQWARWFVESLVDPRKYALRDTSYPEFFADALRTIESRFKNLSKPQKKELASSVAQILQRLASHFRLLNKRVILTRTEKRLLLDKSSDSPSCWICNNAFLSKAIDNFLFQERKEIALPHFIDILKPRGLTQRDMAIEIDHVVPHVYGGGSGENLALACGWCNRHKSAFSSIYDVEGRPRKVGLNKFRINSLPQPFWTVRLLATTRKCQHLEGCDMPLTTTALTVAPITQTGALNPANLMITCYEHDPIMEIRLQAPHQVRAIWLIS